MVTVTSESESDRLWALVSCVTDSMGESRSDTSSTSAHGGDDDDDSDDVVNDDYKVVRGAAGDIR